MKVCKHKSYATAGEAVKVVLGRDGSIALRCDGCERYRVVGLSWGRAGHLRELMTEGRFIAG